MLTPQYATPTDDNDLKTIWYRSVTATHHFLTATDRAAIQRDLPRYFRQVDLLKWQLDGVTIGFSGTSAADLVMLFLDPAYFRHGYGQEIIQYLITHDHVRTVTVNAQNPGALAFYQRQGFKIASRAATDTDGRPYPIINLVLDH